MPEQVPQQAASAPTVVAANRVAVTSQNTDITVAFGHTRQAYDNEGNHFATAVEYQSAVSLSPSTAKQLLVILAATVTQYEARWGNIGLDPTFIQQVEDKMRDPEPAAEKPTAKRRGAKKPGV